MRILCIFTQLLPIGKKLRTPIVATGIGDFGGFNRTRFSMSEIQNRLNQNPNQP